MVSDDRPASGEPARERPRPSVAAMPGAARGRAERRPWRAIANRDATGKHSRRSRAPTVRGPGLPLSSAGGAGRTSRPQREPGDRRVTGPPSGGTSPGAAAQREVDGTVTEHGRKVLAVLRRFDGTGTPMRPEIDLGPCREPDPIPGGDGWSAPDRLFTLRSGMPGAGRRSALRPHAPGTPSVDQYKYGSE